MPHHAVRLLLLLGLSACVAARPHDPSVAPDPTAELARRSAALLDAYGHKDNARLQAMLDPERVAFSARTRRR